MRIISGKCKGKKLLVPKGLPVRPTTDRAKEGLFNILHHRWFWEGLRVLDLFAGTGNISFEFGSRGVREVTAVERFAGCTRYISKVSEELDLPITVFTADVFTYLRQSKGQQYDVVFADPPYQIVPAELSKLVALVFEREVLAAAGLLVVEHAAHVELSADTQYTEKRRYGDSVFSFFERS